jgi:hypothetical protein
MYFNFLPELLCGTGYAFNWEAISSIATVAAVIVALWLAFRNKQERRLEQLELETRAANMVSLTLSGFADVLKKAIEHLKERGGLTIDAPGSDVLYCVENCQSILDRESFFHQLPTAYLDRAELVLSLAKMWVREIDVRRKVQKDPELRELLNLRSLEGVVELGTLLRVESISLREMCMRTRDSFARKNSSLINRLFGRNE